MSGDRAAVAFKDLCLDANDPVVAAAFWSSVLRLETTVQEGGDVVLTDGIPEHTLWVNRVPEAKTAKHRVHLDVYVQAVADLTALGARVVEDHQRWTVLVDPEGGELCAFVRPAEALPDFRLYELGVDATDAERITRWWAARFGVDPQRGDDGSYWFLDETPGLPWPVAFANVPEPKTVKNRLHWDVWGSTPELLAVGATLLRARDEEIAWDVLADPEGNEFCVFSRPKQG